VALKGFGVDGADGGGEVDVGDDLFGALAAKAVEEGVFVLAGGGGDEEGDGLGEFFVSAEESWWIMRRTPSAWRRTSVCVAGMVRRTRSKQASAADAAAV
jgi:hypothetical protein